jgi:hypothetical protein
LGITVPAEGIPARGLRTGRQSADRVRRRRFAVTGEKCQPNTVHWTYNTWAYGHGLARVVDQQPMIYIGDNNLIKPVMFPLAQLYFTSDQH